MKKVLFATTALVLSAGVAAAEVSLSGDGRMGVTWNGDDFNFNSRARVKFTLSGESDSGIAFGGSFRVNDEKNGAGQRAASQGGDGSVFVSGAFGRVEMGDVVGAPEALFGDFYEVGYSDLDGASPMAQGGNDIAYLTGDGNNNIIANNNPTLLYTYSSGPIALAASFTDGKVAQSSVDDDQAMAVAGSYTWQNYTVGLGYEYVDYTAGGDAGQVELAFVGAFGATNVKAILASGTNDSNLDTYFGIGADYTMDAWTFGGYVQYYENDVAGFGTDTAADNAVWYGVGAEYDLGGGLSVKGGIADSDLRNSDMIADLGMKFSF